MSKAVNSKWKKTFPDTIGNQNRPATGVDDTQPFETGAFPQYMANDPVRYDLQNAAMSQSMSNDARLKEMVDARGKELDDHKVDPGAHKTGIAGNAATATKVVTTAASGASANIAEATMASNDLARIRVSGETNAGELALETADDGSEPIVARQYTGIYETPVRTAKILDESGNTSFPGTVVAPKFTGSLNGNSATATKLQTPRTLSLSGKAAGSATFDGSANASINVKSVNADTASKLSTARKINITGNATGSTSFDGSGDVNISTTVNESKHAVNADTATNANHASNADNADTVDGIHAASLFYNKGSWDADNWGTIGAYEVRDNPPISDAYTWGQVISSSTNEARFQLYASHAYGGTGRLHYRTGWDNDKSQPWNTILDSENYNLFAPTKTGSGASGTWGINISGNAATATTANALNGIINREPATNNHAIIPGADNRDYCEFHEFGAVWNFIKTSNEGSKTVASIRSDGFHGNVVGNAASATNADKVDGYHASDLLRILGGNRTPVITDIFDRAGTIDMSTMSAADKAKHKANINKASNVTQNIWNNSTGIHAYGGELDMNGYSRGALKLTQSYKNFDKIFVVGSNDDGNHVAYKLWNVYELAYAFSHSFRFHFIFEDDVYWNLYGSVRTGTDTDYVLSTDTILNCHDQNCGIIAIYGIKY